MMRMKRHALPYADQPEPRWPSSRTGSSTSAPTAAVRRSSQATASRRASSISAWSRSRSPTRSVGRPDWRVPKKSPGPRSCQIALGDHEAVGRLDERVEPRAPGLAERRLIQQHARRRVRAAADAAAQLVQLRQAEPLRVLDDHHRRVRHVDADLDDRRRHEHVRRRRARTRPSRGPSRPASAGRAAARRVYSGNTSACRWSAIAVAARRSTFSDSSTSG